HRATARLGATPERSLRAAAASVGANWPELLAAGIAANLQSLTGQRRQVLAMPVLARSGQVRRTPGIATNIVPLIVDVDTEQPLAALVDAVAAELRATRRHQRLRFEEMARLVPPDVGLFGPQLNIKPYASAIAFAATPAEIRNLATGPVDDLSFIAVDHPDGSIDLALDGNAQRHTAAEVDAHLARVAETLRACCDPAALARPVGALPTTTAADRAQVVQAFNDTAAPVAATTLAARFVEQVARTPDAPAVGDTTETISYAELHARASRLAAALRAAGAGPETIVGLQLQRSVGLSVAVIGTLLAGAAYLPIDPELPQERRDYVLGDARPACLVNADWLDLGAAPEGVAPITIDRSGAVVGAPVEVDHVAAPRCSGGHPADASAPRGAPFPPADLAPHHPAYVIYTSGSTGRPKGVVTEHAAIVNRLAWMQHALPIGPGDAILQKTPYGFDVSVWELTWPLLEGARIVMAEPGGHRDPAYLAATIQREAITVAHFVPSMLDLFLGEPSAADCTSLRHVVCSGEALPGETARRYHERLSAPLHNLYGPTEAAIDVTAWTSTPVDPPGPVPIGRPIWNTRTYVLDDAHRPMPVGAPGELWLAGANLAREYLGRPDLTAERFLPDPFAASGAGPGSAEPMDVGPAIARGERMYRTGDLARWRPDGAIDYLGRTDDQVKLRGLRIELGEIQETLARHPAVARAAASVEASGAAPRLVAHVVLAAEPTNTPDDKTPAAPPPATVGAADPDLAAALRDHAARSLPDYMVPAAFAVVEALPLSPNGKLDRRQLPPIAADADAPGDPEAPSSPREQRLCELFARALQIDRVGPHDHLFTLGADSLLAASLVGTIRAELGVSISLGAIFAAPTPAALAARIDDGGDLAALDLLLPLRAGGDAPPLYCVHPAGGIGWCYAGLTRTVQDRPIVAIQAPGVSTDADAPATLVELAARYADAILSIHPGGPVHLAGWSVGGVLAQAIAVDLQRRGQPTGVLALLDAYPGEQWAGQAPPTPEETLVALLHMGGLGEPALAGATPTLDRVLAALTREGSALAALGDDTFRRVARVVTESSRLMREHRTEPVDGDLLFFAATAPRREDWLDAAAWAAHARGTTRTVELDCTHAEMPRRGPIDVIGAAIAEALAVREAGVDDAAAAAIADA
ncbi:MAG: amino acid adenylation domain-containing protein, partial [Patulibacter sp.]|nr:amino acid adenylation domain-containing protein [Patulibacter sp.]